jgi:hypothetical protein
MKNRICYGALAVFMLCLCSPDKPSPLFLTILVPHDGDTVTTLVNSVEGKAYTGARVTIGFGNNSVDTTLIPDDTGRFVGTYKIPTDEPGNYSVYITASYQGLSIPETRMVYYKQ